MEADDLGMKLHHEVAHFVVEGGAGGLWNGSISISLQLGVIGIQALYPVPFSITIVLLRLVAEEVCINGERCFSANCFKLVARLFHAQQRTSKRTEPSSL